jgi:hypothetical protein
MAKKKKLGSEIYSGAASFGKVWAIIGAVMSTLIGIGMIIIGITILVHKDRNPHTTATVIACPKPDNNCCDAWTDANNVRQYSCVLQVKYNVNGKDYTKVINTTGTTQYNVGSTVPISYDPNNPQDVKTSFPPPHWLGWVLIVLALIVIFGSWVWVWLTRKYKFAAAAQGVAGGVHLLKGAF